MELVTGRVAKSHGVHGELVVDVRTDSPDERFAAGATVRLRHNRDAARTQERVVLGAREHSGRLLVRLDGVSDRAGADALRGWLFVVDSESIGAAQDPDEFYDHELEGLTVVGVDGTEVGVLREVLHTAAGELLAVDRADERGEVLVPFVAAMVPTVDLAGRRVVVDPPEGLLEL